MSAARTALDLYMRPALAWLRDCQPRASGRAAETLMLAIALRESDCRHRIQVGHGGKPLPMWARGFWQFERDGGVAEICQHPALAWCRSAILDLGYEIERDRLHEAIGYDQTLAAVMARGLLWIDPAALPAPVASSVEIAYAYYIRRWRPGRPRPEKWGANWRTAVQLTREEWSE